MSAWSINIVSVYIKVQCTIFMFNYIVSTILTSSTYSVSVHNDWFMGYNKWMNEMNEDENRHLLLVLSLLMSGLNFRMTTPVIIDDKCVPVNPVSFGAHSVSWVKKKNCTYKYVLKNITCIWQEKWIKFFKSLKRSVSIKTWHHHITKLFELKCSAIPILAVSFV